MSEILYDSDFNLEQTHCYILSIQLRLNGFSFFIADPDKNKLVAFLYTGHKISDESFMARRFEEWANGIDVLKKPFQKIRVILYNKHFSLYPESFNNHYIKNRIKDFMFPKDQSSGLAENVLPNSQARICYNLPAGLNEVLNQFLGEHQLVHPIGLMLEKAQSKQANTGPELVLSLNDSSLYVTITANNKLLMANSFHSQHDNDILFFLVNSVQQLGVPPEQLTLNVVGGEIEPGLDAKLKSLFPAYNGSVSFEDIVIDDEFLKAEPSIKLQSFFI